MIINVGDYVLCRGKAWKIIDTNDWVVGIDASGRNGILAKCEITKIASGTNRLERYEQECVWVSSAFNASRVYDFEPVYTDMNTDRVELSQYLFPEYDIVWSDDN